MESIEVFTQEKGDDIWTLIGIVDHEAQTIEILKHTRDLLDEETDGKFKLLLNDYRITQVIIKASKYGKMFKVLNSRHVYSYTLPTRQ